MNQANIAELLALPEDPTYASFEPWMVGRLVEVVVTTPRHYDRGRLVPAHTKKRAGRLLSYRGAAFTIRDTSVLAYDDEKDEMTITVVPYSKDVELAESHLRTKILFQESTGRLPRQPLRVTIRSTRATARRRARNVRRLASS